MPDNLPPTHTGSNAPPPPADFSCSDSIGHLIGALAEANKTITNPTKNREVEVYMRKTGGTYKFSYATLDHILGIIRPPLAENGLVFTQIIVVKKLISMLAHSSGEWMRSVQDISYDGGLQDYGSALSYLRRYSVLAMLSLSAEDDDDGVAASGDREIVTPEEAAARRREIETRKRQQQRGDQPLHPIQETARLVKDQAGGLEIMRAWRDETTALEDLRDDPDWSLLINEVGGAVARAFGKIIGAAWLAGVRATSMENLRKIEELWNGSWLEEREQLQAANPQAHEVLTAHLMAQQARINQAPPPPPQATREPRQPAPAARPATHGMPTQMFGHHVYDAFGDVASDLLVDPNEWARQFLAGMTDTDMRQAMIHYNGDGIDAALVSGDLAANLAEDLQEALKPPPTDTGETATAPPAPPAPPAADAVDAAPETPPANPPPPANGDEEGLIIPVPKTAGGGLDMIAYTRALRGRLTDLNLAQISALRRANEATINTLPPLARDAAFNEFELARQDAARGTSTRGGK